MRSYKLHRTEYFDINKNRKTRSRPNLCPNSIRILPDFLPRILPDRISTELDTLAFFFWGGGGGIVPPSASLIRLWLGQLSSQCRPQWRSLAWYMRSSDKARLSDYLEYHLSIYRPIYKYGRPIIVIQTTSLYTNTSLEPYRPWSANFLKYNSGGW